MEHPASPIFTGRNGGRNAGSIIVNDGKLYRPVQVCESSYGEQISIMQIEHLTPTEYKESLYKSNIINKKISPYSWGGHQWNCVDFMGNRVVATDYREKNYNLVEFARRIKRKIIR